MDAEQPISQPQPSSFLNRAANVFMAPGELYAEVATVKEQTTSWVIPMILAIVVALLSVMTVYTNPSFKQQLLEAQRQALQQKVENGEMTEAQRARAEEFLESSSMSFYFGVGASVIGPPIVLFCAALGIWLFAKLALKATAGYQKWLELYGLASLIGVVGTVISLITMHLFDSIHATASGSLLLSTFNPAEFSHRLLAAITLFGIWQTAVVGIGVAKIAGKPTGTTVLLVYGLWLAVVLVEAATGFLAV